MHKHRIKRTKLEIDQIRKIIEYYTFMPTQLEVRQNKLLKETQFT